MPLRYVLHTDDGGSFKGSVNVRLLNQQMPTAN